MSDQFLEFHRTELGSRRLWLPFERARALEEASEGYSPEKDELEAAWNAFCKNNRLDPLAPTSVPAEWAGCPIEQLKSVVDRDLRIAKWKKTVFETEAEEHFVRRKPALDRVVYSLLRVKEPGLARELWFRIKEREATFAELAPDYASGNEIYTAGIVGPVAYGAMHPALAAQLQPAAEGQLLRPLSIAEWFLVARVEHQLPVEYNEAMKQQMIEELAAQWLNERAHG
jgi:hypothetical protein